MKYLATLVFLLASFLSAQAQNNNDSENIKSIAQQFLKAIVNENYDVAKELATDDTDRMIEQLKMFSTLVPDSLKPEMDAARAVAKKAVLKFYKVRVVGDIAIVKFTSSQEPEKEETIKLTLVNNKWLVDMGGDMPLDDEEVIEED